MIEIDNVTRSFAATVAVDNVSLTVETGELFGLLGPNGAGKSTLINMVTGLLAPDSGTVRFTGFGGEKAPAEVRHELGLVPQDLAFYGNYTAAENIRFFASLYGLRGAALSRAVDAAMELAGLTGTGSKQARVFSGGMKRRLNIACGVVHGPQVIVLDEPTVGIDPQSRHHILRAVDDLRRQGRTVIYTTHYMEEAETLCTRVAIIDRGKVIAHGTNEQLKLLIRDACRVSFRLKNPEEVALEPFRQITGVIAAEVDDLVIRVTSQVGADNLNALTGEINRQRLVVTDIRSDAPSLETVFLSLTGRSLRD